MVMPALGATATHWSRMDLPNASVPEISATVVRLRCFRSAKILSHAILSVCGVLNTHLRTGSMIWMAPASEINGICASSNRGIMASVAPVVVPPIMATTLSSDQAGGKGARGVGVGAVVVHHELQ